MPAARLVEHRWTARREKATEMQLSRRDVDIVERCWEMEFRFYRREGDALVELVANFKYLGRLLDQTDDDWPAV